MHQSLVVRVVLAIGAAVVIWPAAAPAQTLPDPIYWRQNLFLIPYQWSAAIEPGGAESVWLYVSKDRGATWQKISEAQPQVRAFTYHAEADGEYWFAIRTTDGQGRFSPAGPIEPELRVIVDTTIPRFEQVVGAVRGDGTLDIRWRVADANLDARSWQVEVQTDAADDWRAVTLSQPTSVDGTGIAEGRATAQIAHGGGPLAVRVATTDLAGNRAVSQASVSPVAVEPTASDTWPTISVNQSDDRPPTGYDPAVDDYSNDAYGWVASRPTADESRSTAAAALTAPAVASQPWPADNRAASESRSFANAAREPADAGGTYGTPHDTTATARANPAQPSGDVPSAFASYGGPSVEHRAPYAPLEPFRQRNVKPWEAAGQDAEPYGGAETGAATGLVDPWLWLSGPDVSVPAGVTPKLVNSRTFVLEYELEGVGPWGVAKVELWGTRDAGRTWRSYATDVDHASPMQVTVGDAGLYGFRIVVSGGGGVGGFPPQPGDRPELWVGVDLHRPEIELTGAEPGTGELAGHLLLEWWAADDNLERRPIGLFYSSRPVGPWTAIATNLSNTGEYPWRLERHLPPRVYLRLEARDGAGNLAAYQTYEPVSIELPPPSGRIESVESLDGPTAWSDVAAPR